MKLKNKFAIGCFVQWYEVELVEEYIESVKQSLSNIHNPKNIIVDICFNMAQNLEEIDESQMKLDDIFQRFLKIRASLDKIHRNVRVNFYPINKDEFNNKKLKPYTIADYRREFNNKYCEKVDVLMWGETDALIPKQTFEVLDLLHNNNIENKTNKYIAFFGTCKMWDESWQSIEHVDFTDKPFVDMDTKNWWSLRYNMNIDEMDDINDKVEQLDVRTVNPFKFNGCGLVISSDVIKAGVNIPRSAFFIHEDTAFMFSLIKNLGENIPQFIFKNILLVHNRKHPKKRMYVKGERNIELGDVGSARKVHDWYKKASDMSHHNVYNLFNQSKIYTWEDVFK
jgi:hypothetical protein